MRSIVAVPSRVVAKRRCSIASSRWRLRNWSLTALAAGGLKLDEKNLTQYLLFLGEGELARFVADQARKRALYGETYPIDEDFLAALEHGLPECAGAALGFDRLVMLATGADDIEDVLWAPVR